MKWIVLSAVLTMSLMVLSGKSVEAAGPPADDSSSVVAEPIVPLPPSQRGSYAYGHGGYGYGGQVRNFGPINSNAYGTCGVEYFNWPDCACCWSVWDGYRSHGHGGRHCGGGCRSCR